MKAKSMALVIAFAGLTIVLNPAISGIAIPYPPLPAYLAFNVWEIPIIVVFLLFGFKFGVAVTGINALFAFSIWPGPSNPFLTLGTVISAISMMTGIYVMFKVIGHRIPAETLEYRTRLIVLGTVFASLLRIVFQASWTYFLLKSPLFNASDSFVFTLWLPWQAVFNVLQPVITVPLAFVIAWSVNKNIRMENGPGFSSMLV